MIEFGKVGKRLFGAMVILFGGICVWGAGFNSSLYVPCGYLKGM